MTVIRYSHIASIHKHDRKLSAVYNSVFKKRGMSNIQILLFYYAPYAPSVVAAILKNDRGPNVIERDNNIVF